jgi:hypothetical protein
MLKFTQNAAASAAEMEDEILAIEINDIATIIKARTKNQFLAITERPIIASGDVETVLVHFEFDPAWAAFDVKFACFYKANQPHIVYKMLISDDGYATVPPEVLDDAGNIFFGVKGYISDLPQLRKTSLNVMYEIRNGSSPSGDNAPTPDEFTQMLQEMGNIKQEVANEIAEMNAALEEMKKQLDEKLQDDWDFNEWLAGEYNLNEIFDMNEDEKDEVRERYTAWCEECVESCMRDDGYTVEETEVEIWVSDVTETQRNLNGWKD